MAPGGPNPAAGNLAQPDSSWGLRMHTRRQTDSLIALYSTDTLNLAATLTLFMNLDYRIFGRGNPRYAAWLDNMGQARTISDRWCIYFAVCPEVALNTPDPGKFGNRDQAVTDRSCPLYSDCDFTGITGAGTIIPFPAWLNGVIPVDGEPLSGLPNGPFNPIPTPGLNPNPDLSVLPCLGGGLTGGASPEPGAPVVADETTLNWMTWQLASMVSQGAISPNTACNLLQIDGEVGLTPGQLTQLVTAFEGEKLNQVAWLGYPDRKVYPLHRVYTVCFINHSSGKSSNIKKCPVV